MPQDYNFFGQSAAPQAFSPSPQQLAQAMQMPEYNNPTPSSYKSEMPDMGMMGRMLKPDNGSGSANPNNLMSYGSPAGGPLPWLAENQLPWLKGGG